MSSEELKSGSTASGAAALSNSGKVREHNEDSFALFPRRGLFMVSDGMGGHRAGAIASRLVVDQLPQMIAERLDSLPTRKTKTISLALRDMIVDLSQQVCKQAQTRPELNGMGATLVLGYLRKSRLYIANMGDSRAYLCRNGKLEQQTEDHSIVGILVQDGEITAEEAKTHPARGTVSRFIGMEGLVYPDVKSVTIGKGDKLLLCSDGLTGMVSDETIAEILSKENDLMRACESLVAAANEAGGRDNVTVLIAHLNN